MDALVTGAAGFIGSTLTDRLLADGHRVRGVDSFTPYYDESRKRANLAAALAQPGFTLVERDLRDAAVDDLLDDVEVVFHHAAQPGVRGSWADGFAEYLEQNVGVTQRLLEAARRRSLHRFVFASSSSVYGEAERYPTTEDDLPRPHSPYGVTKLAAEHLCNLYAGNHGVPTVSLRYFTVYGPRQRPDMAVHRMIEAALTGTTFPVYGSVEQEREFTHVDDVVAAALAAGTTDVAPGAVMNVGGGASASVGAVLDLVEATTGATVGLDHGPGAPGDVRRTGASIERAASVLGWKPVIGLADGVASQVAWHRAEHAGPR